MAEWVWWNKGDGIAVGPRDKGCEAIVFTVEEAQAICRAVNEASTPSATRRNEELNEEPSTPPSVEPKIETSMADMVASLNYLHLSTAPDGQWADQALHSFVGVMLKSAPSTARANNAAPQGGGSQSADESTERGKGHARVPPREPPISTVPAVAAPVSSIAQQEPWPLKLPVTYSEAHRAIIGSDGILAMSLHLRMPVIDGHAIARIINSTAPSAMAPIDALSGLIRAVDGMADMDEADGPEFFKAEKALNDALATAQDIVRRADGGAAS